MLHSHLDKFKNNIGAYAYISIYKNIDVAKNATFWPFGDFLQDFEFITKGFLEVF